MAVAWQHRGLKFWGRPPRDSLVLRQEGRGLPRLSGPRAGALTSMPPTPRPPRARQRLASKAELRAPDRWSVASAPASLCSRRPEVFLKFIFQSVFLGLRLVFLTSYCLRRPRPQPRTSGSGLIPLRSTCCDPQIPPWPQIFLHFKIPLGPPKLNTLTYSFALPRPPYAYLPQIPLCSPKDSSVPPKYHSIALPTLKSPNTETAPFPLPHSLAHSDVLSHLLGDLSPYLRTPPT